MAVKPNCSTVKKKGKDQDFSHFTQALHICAPNIRYELFVSSKKNFLEKKMTAKTLENSLAAEPFGDPNVRHKNSVFTLLFSDPDALRELYSAIGGVNLPLDIPIDINTLSNVLYMGKLNDVSFTIDNRLVVLIEHQSTINENMPIRLLIYISDVYKKIIDRKKLYQKKLEKIPKPEFIVLYNGNEPYPDHKELRLSEAFKKVEGLKAVTENLPLELVVQVYNINLGHNSQILEKSKTLGGYSVFIDKINEYKKNNLSLEESMKTAIKYCVENDILRNFLEKHSSEVMNMILDWNWDDAIEAWQEEAREEGLADGLAKGRAQEREYLLELLDQGLSLEEIKQRIVLHQQPEQ